MEKKIFLVALFCLVLPVSAFAQLEITIEYGGDAIKEGGKIEIDEKEEVELYIEAESDMDDARIDLDIDMEDEEARVPSGVDVTKLEENKDGNRAWCTLLWTPSYDQSGVYDFLVLADDADRNLAEFTFTIEVYDVNRPPPEPEKPRPKDGDTVYFHEGELVLSWDGVLEDEDGDAVEYRIVFWKQGDREVPLYDEEGDFVEFAITKFLEAGTYFWQVMAIDEHGLATDGPVWELIAGQWLNTWLDATKMDMYLRKPGMYTVKFTDIALQSNGKVTAYFEPDDPVGPDGLPLNLQYGVQAGSKEIAWYDQRWEMQFPVSLSPYSFGLHVRAFAQTRHSAGEYEGELMINFILSQ